MVADVLERLAQAIRASAERIVGDNVLKVFHVAVDCPCSGPSLR